MNYHARMTFPTMFISHGGGPWPWIDEMRREFARTAAWLAALPKTLPEQPVAILSVSGHWEEHDFTVSSAAQPPMIYDYYNFPPHTYQIKYGAQGSPAVAARVSELLGNAGIAHRVDASRGFDHGTFVPLGVMYPHADVPVVSMSLRANLDAREHLRMGAALQPLRDEGVLIIGSGLSYHNLRAFGPAAKETSAAFDDWLQRALAPANFAERARALASWESAPAARQAHPREEHLLPLMVAVGAAENDVATLVYHEDNFFGGISVSNFQFGAGQLGPH